MLKAIRGIETRVALIELYMESFVEIDCTLLFLPYLSVIRVLSVNLAEAADLLHEYTLSQSSSKYKFTAGILSVLTRNFD